ncbi:MAG: hypothetical protein CMK37_07870 [Porticoccaceae bacterium]|nr:hypothetical protein [Porticoccaceae bacterium]|tara:strand:+ start:3998 stop:4387 length:390 start_codon:yes stop_codon:yes gene_type:complete
MTNPANPLANATLVFSVASGYAVDAMTGNFVESTTDETYYATLKQSRDPQYEQRVGADETAIYMKGRLVSPLAASGVSAGDTAKATIEGQEGRFELLPTIEMTEHYQQFLGTPIHGYFRVVGAGSVLNR